MNINTNRRGTGCAATGRSKIHEFYVSRSVDKNILWFDITAKHYTYITQQK